MTGVDVPESRGLAAMRHGRLSLARVIGWFSSEPQRIRAATAGLLVCVLAGAVLGAGLGLVADAVATSVNQWLVGSP